MEFEWDTTNSEKCFTQRGFDFAYVTRAFADPNHLIHKDICYQYSEDRYQLLGAVDQRLFFIVYTIRTTVTRIISARKANSREVKKYEKNIDKNRFN